MPRSGLGVWAVVLAGMAAGVAVLAHGDAPRPISQLETTTTSIKKPDPAANLAALEAGRWTVLPDAPMPPDAPPGHRRSFVRAWTGGEFLIWGGGTAADSHEVLHGDGIAYNPRANRWRSLPPAPIPATAQATAVWTGRELVIWGGLDNVGITHLTAAGAAYDPGTDAWRMIAPSPLAPRFSPVSAWTGREMIVLGGYDVIRNNTLTVFRDVAAYDPARDQWRLLPPVPVPPGHDLQYPTPVWTDSQLLVWWPWLHQEPNDTGFTETSGIDFFRYAAGDDRWDLVPPSPSQPATIGRPFWTGRYVVTTTVRASEGRAGRPSRPLIPAHHYDPAGNTWTALPGGPDHDDYTVWTGSALVGLVTQLAPGKLPCDQRAGCDPPDFESTLWALDPETGNWAQLPTAPITMPGSLFDVATTWTGREILVWGTTTHRPLMENGRPGPLEVRAVGMRFDPRR
jgi:hypothetical protein